MVRRKQRDYKQKGRVKADMTRIKSTTHQRKLMSAEAAAALIAPGTTVGLSGFTG